MKFKVVERKSFVVFGVSTEVNPNKQDNSIGNLWRQCFSDGTSDRMTEIAGFAPGKGEFGSVCYDYNPQTQGFRYMITATKGEKAVPDDLEELVLSEQTWGVFYDVYEDHEDIHFLWEQLFDYLENTEYSCIDGPQLEQYYPVEQGTLCEVWIPIKRK